ncbi:MAG: hypothetical protein HY360_23710 [Verrucomicrobia bacterium]|nr:hypothetical protein [Verrucomicrobiota bacterium]
MIPPPTGTGTERLLAAKHADTTALKRDRPGCFRGTGSGQQVYALYPPSSRSRPLPRDLAPAGSTSGLRRAGGLTPEETCPPIGRRVKIVEESGQR